jgi:hypothetical protein
MTRALDVEARHARKSGALHRHHAATRPVLAATVHYRSVDAKGAPCPGGVGNDRSSTTRGVAASRPPGSLRSSPLGGPELCAVPWLPGLRPWQWPDQSRFRVPPAARVVTAGVAGQRLPRTGERRSGRAGSFVRAGERLGGTRRGQRPGADFRLTRITTRRLCRRRSSPNPDLAVSAGHESGVVDAPIGAHRRFGGGDGAGQYPAGVLRQAPVDRPPRVPSVTRAEPVPQEGRGSPRRGRRWRRRGSALPCGRGSDGPPVRHPLRAARARLGNPGGGRRGAGHCHRSRGTAGPDRTGALSCAPAARRGQPVRGCPAAGS